MPQLRPAPSSAILIEVGSGELLDKITILEIKAERIRDPSSLQNVEHELATLKSARLAYLGDSWPELSALEAELKTVNLQLWEIEDDIRRCEQRSDFGPNFIALARAVYRTNDRRADIKRTINRLTGARIVEEKSYAETTTLKPAQSAAGIG